MNNAMKTTAPVNDPPRLTLPALLAQNASGYGNDRTAIREKALGIWQTYGWRDYFDQVRKTALGLASLSLRRAETVFLIVSNSPRWLFCQLGSHTLGLQTLNLFTSCTPQEIALAMRHIQPSILIVQDQEQVDKLYDIRDRLSFVRKVIYISEKGMAAYENDSWLMSYADLIRAGEAFEKDHADLIDEAISKGRDTDTAVLIQTSGTTGLPKMAMFSHRSILAMGRQWLKDENLHVGENWLSMSSPAWIIDQMWVTGVSLCSASTVNFPETAETLKNDFREIGPTRLIATSQFWQEMASQIRVKMSDAGWLKRKLFDYAEAVGEKVVKRKQLEKPVSLYLLAVNTTMRWIVHRPLLDRMGLSHLQSAFSGGHPISPNVITFFHAIGLNLRQCYGLTESGGMFQIQKDGAGDPGNVGKPLSSTEVQISRDHEILVKSEANFTGYVNDYAATEAAFENGWLKTGDAGSMDKDGCLMIIGRLEELIRGKAGDMFSPDFIETRLQYSTFIKEAIVFASARPYVTAMINIDLANVGNWAEKRKIPYTTYMDLSSQREVQELILSQVRVINEELPEALKIRKFVLLYKLLDADDEELTHTGKVRRRFVYGLYIDIIEAMYSNRDRVSVKGKIQYRDGRTGEIETILGIISVD